MRKSIIKPPGTPTKRSSLILPPISQTSSSSSRGKISTPKSTEIEWSDEEEDEEKQLAKYKLPGVNPRMTSNMNENEEEKNKLLITRQEMMDEPSVTSPDRLFDHHRSFFSGEIRMKEYKTTKQKQDELNLQLSLRNTRISVPSSSSSSSVTALGNTSSSNLIPSRSYPNINNDFYNVFEEDLIEAIWQEALKVLNQVNKQLGLLIVNKSLYLLLQWIDEQIIEQSATIIYKDIRNEYELNDFIDFSNFLTFLQKHYYHSHLTTNNNSNNYKKIGFHDGRSRHHHKGKENQGGINKTKNPMGYDRTKETITLPVHCCTHAACQICTYHPDVLDNLPHVSKISHPSSGNGVTDIASSSQVFNNNPSLTLTQETSLEAILNPEESENIQHQEEEEEVDINNEGFTKEELYRIETIYRKYHNNPLYGNKIKKKLIFNIMKECLIPFDKKKIPENFWNLSSDLLIYHINDIKQLIRQFRKVPEIDEREVLIDSILRYPLPSWLKLEFKISEILLYQHQFSLIDIDGGGSIDAEELQYLFTSIGSAVTLDEAKAIVAEYDLDGGGTIDFTEFMILIYKIQRGTINLKNNDLGQILMESKAQLKIFEEIEQVHSHPPPYCSIGHYGGSPIICECHIVGPEDTPYANQQITVEIVLHDGYPYCPPELKILSNRILHVNIMNQLMGFSRLLHFHQIWQNNWDLNQLLQHIVEVLQNPRIDLLPASLLSIYEDWQREYEKRQRKKEKQEKEEIEEGRDRSTFVKIEELSPPKTVEKIKKLNRIEQMHLQILFLYLTNRQQFYQMIEQQLITEPQKPSIED